jgi:hypothetical protein
MNGFQFPVFEQIVQYQPDFTLHPLGDLPSHLIHCERISALAHYRADLIFQVHVGFPFVLSAKQGEKTHPILSAEKRGSGYLTHSAGDQPLLGN